MNGYSLRKNGGMNGRFLYSTLISIIYQGIKLKLQDISTIQTREQHNLVRGGSGDSLGSRNKDLRNKEIKISNDQENRRSSDSKILG